MTTPLRKLRVSDEEYALWRAAAPDGNVSAWLRGLAAAALARDAATRARANPASIGSRAAEPLPIGAAPVAEPDVPAVTIGEASPDPARAEYLRREAALANLNQEV